MNIPASRFPAVRCDDFWQDDDVRWLTGVHATDAGIEQFDPQAFATFVCWLQLPALIAVAEDASSNPKAANDVTAIAANLAYAARISSFDCQRFLDFLHAEDSEPHRQFVEEPEPTIPGKDIV
jgi:hypothetical protein